VDFADFARDREALFRDFLTLEHGLPSHDTFSRLFRLLDPAALGACFGRFLEGLGADGRGVVAIDGKTLRRSFDRAAGASASPRQRPGPRATPRCPGRRPCAACVRHARSSRP